MVITLESHSYFHCCGAQQAVAIDRQMSYKYNVLYETMKECRKEHKECELIFAAEAIYLAPGGETYSPVRTWSPSTNLYGPTVAESKRNLSGHENHKDQRSKPKY